MPYAGKTTTATHDYKFWGGDSQPWRHGLDDTPVTDQTVIASEEQHKVKAEADDELEFWRVARPPAFWREQE